MKIERKIWENVYRTYKHFLFFADIIGRKVNEILLSHGGDCHEH